MFTGVRDDIAAAARRQPTCTSSQASSRVSSASPCSRRWRLGKPVVAFETEDVKLALTDGETGLIVPNGDVEQLAERILYLLDNP